MSQNLLWKVNTGENVRLNHYDPSYVAKGIDENSARDEMIRLGRELDELQDTLSAAQHNSLLIVLQGMDTSGKDGTIRHVMSNVNPQGCEVHSFKEPTPEELSHDFLWRVHTVTPPLGKIGIFNRSHYEDVLVVRVHNLVPEDVWRRRYKEINDFEKLLARNGTIVLKFFLHISKDEQQARLRDRMNEKDKAWKLSASDFAERPYWNAYQEAYEAALSECSTDEAPWYIVPANHKWYRNLAVASTLVETMRRHRKDWEQELAQRGRQELDAIQKLRDEGKLKDL